MSSQFENYKSQCAKTLDHYKKELSRLRSGRATPSLLEGLMVNYYGSSVSLQQLGMVAAPEPRMLTIQVYDGGAMESIEKAIQQSDLGLNPSRDGSMIRVVIPALNEERRKDLIKKVKKKVKNKEMTEDDSRRSQDEIQKIGDKFIVDVDAAAAAKEKEMMEV